MRLLLLLTLLAATPGGADVRQTGPYQWTGVERIVAIGDLHGDYDNYLATLKAAGLVDRRGRWVGGQAHLVQLGDIPDRGPDTRRIIEHLGRLARQARRSGGRVHHLIGNHEAMNVHGDLRFVTTAEFAAFADRGSARLRDRYYRAWLDALEARDPDAHAALPDDHRAEWNQAHPLGWVEHRMSWDPRWDGDQRMFEWVMASPVAVQINDMIFVHGGISARYCRNSLASLTEQVHAALREPDRASRSILEDPLGPLWYRGLAGVEPSTPSAIVSAILEHHQARHIVIAHTPTGGSILPRYGGRVIQVDTGIGRYYGGHIAYLEATPAGLQAGYLKGKLRLPEDQAGLIEYLGAVAEMHPDNSMLQRRLERAGQQDWDSPQTTSEPAVSCGSWP